VRDVAPLEVIPVSFVADEYAPAQVAGVFCVPGGEPVNVIVPDESGRITVKQAALMCGVTEMTVRNWYNRGWHDENKNIVKMPVAHRYKGIVYLDPVEVAKAERATAERARRIAA
jgi:hypothetical protein